MAKIQERKLEAVVLGNGPSLINFDFSRLSGFDVFGMNAAYRYWYEINWFPQYYSCLDIVVGDSHRDAIIKLIRNSDRLGIRAFLLRQSLIEKLGKVASSQKIINFDLLRPGFQSWSCGPVTTGSHTCAWASILGYRDIYLLGIDCNYVEIVSNAKRVDDTVLEIADNAPNPNYFFDSYQKKGDKYNIPNPRKDLHLQSWRNVWDKCINRSRVLNANLSSKVDIFPFVRFEDIENEGHVPILSQGDVLKGSAKEKSIHYFPSRTPESLTECRFSTAKYKKTIDQVGLEKIRSIIFYDTQWKSTSITEQLAFLQAVKLLPETPAAWYFGFSWAVLIDLLITNNGEGNRLNEVLTNAGPLLKQKKHVITACQHRDMLKFQKLFADAGVTHVFWPYTCKGLDRFPEYKNIKISPLPLATVHTLDFRQPEVKERRYLYSFVESKRTSLSKSQAHEFILNHMAKDNQGIVIAHDQWDFSTIVRGLKGQADADISMVGGNSPAPIEFWKILQNSVFSLCPSDPGVNSSRLWESLACGSIPVIFSDTRHLPGINALWEEAVVVCSESSEDIAALPDHLENIAHDKSLLERKQHAMRQLWVLYGPNFFIYDIHKLFLNLAREDAEKKTDSSFLSYGRLYAMASVINQHPNLEKLEYNSFILGCGSRVISDPSGFKSRLEVNADFRNAYKKALSLCKKQYSDSIGRVLKFQDIVLN